VRELTRERENMSTKNAGGFWKSSKHSVGPFEINIPAILLFAAIVFFIVGIECQWTLVLVPQEKRPTNVFVVDRGGFDLLG